MTLNIASLFNTPNLAQRELSDDEVFGAAPAQPQPAAQAPRELTDEEVFAAPAAAPGYVARGDGSELRAQPVTLWERLRANASEAFFGGTSTGVAADAAAQAAARRVSPEMGDQVLAAQREREAANARLPSWTEEQGLVDQILHGAAALTGQVAGSLPAIESVFALPAKAGASALRMIARRGTEQAAINTAIDPALQGARIAGGIQDEYDAVQTALQAPLGFLIGGGMEAATNAKAVAAAFRDWRAKRNQDADPNAAPAPEEIAQFEASPELQAFMASNGITDPADPRMAQLQERLAARRAAEAESGQRPINTDRVQLRAEKEAIEAGDLNPAAAPAASARREPVPEVIVPEATATPGNAAGVGLRGAFNAPVPVSPQPPRGMTQAEAARARADMESGAPVRGDEDPLFVSPEGTAGRRGETLPEQTGLALPSPEGASRVPMSDAEAARARAAIDGGNANQAPGMERAVAPEGRAPRTPGDIEADRQAREAFDLAQRQRDRLNPETRDTQPAGRPEGVNAQPVMLDDGFPVQIIERRMVPDNKGNMVEVAKVQRYDPRTGKVDPDAPDYEVPVRQLKRGNYAQEPRRAQDFVEQSQSPRNPEQPRTAGPGEPTRERAQTFRATEPDPSVRGAEGPTSEAPGRGPAGRASRPEQPEGPGPWRERPRSEEEALRRFAEARAREEAARARGDAPRQEGPRATDDKATNTPKPEKDGRWQTDDRGFILSDKGGPVRFADQKQAAKWIVAKGHRATIADQILEIAVHPSGKGFTVRETGRSDPKPSAKPAEAAPEAAAASPEPIRALPPPARAEAPAAAPEAPPAPAPKARPEAPRQAAPDVAPAPPASVTIREVKLGRSRAWSVSTKDAKGNRIGADFVTPERHLAQKEKAKRDAVVRRERGKERANIEPFQDDGRPLLHQLNEEIEADVFGSRVSPEAVAERYGISEQDAADLLKKLTGRPDGNVSASQAGRFTKSTGNSERINENLVWAENEFGISVQDYPSTAAFFDDVEARVKDRAEADARAELDSLEAEWSRYADDASSLSDELSEFDIDTGRRLSDDADEYARAPREEDIPFDETQAATSQNTDPASRDGGDGDPLSGRSEPPRERTDQPSGDRDTGERAGGSGDGRSARTERTAAGEQGVIAGAERSAQQAQNSRDASGGLRSSKPQKPADDGLFDTGARAQSDIFDAPRAPSAPDSLPKGFDPSKLSANPFADPAVWAHVFGWPVREAKRWADSGSDLVNSIKRAREDGAARNVLGKNLIRSVLYSADSEARAIADRLPTANARKIMHDALNEWHSRAGEGAGVKETFDEAVATRSTKRINDLGDILKPFEGNDAALGQITKLAQAAGAPRAGTPIGDAAIKLRAFLAEELKYLRASGIEMGEVGRGYFPRVTDEMAVARNRTGFEAKASEAYRRLLGMSRSDADEAASAWASRILYGENGGRGAAPGGAIEANFLKGRTLPKEADAILRDFLIQDPRQALVSYTVAATRRAEFTRRMGTDDAKWDAIVAGLKKEGAENAVGPLREYISVASGTKATGFSPGALSTMSWLRVWSTLGLLEKATLSSLAEVILPAVRTGNITDIGRTIGSAVSDLVNKTGKSAAQRREVAEFLGAISSHMDPALMAARWANGSPTSELQNKVLGKFFTRTGLEQWTNATRIAAVGVGQTFVKRLAGEAVKDSGKARFLLAELGIPREKAADFGKWLKAQNNGMPPISAMTGEMGDLYRTALNRFVDQSIMRPSASTRPRWASHPFGAVVFQLMNYTYAFQKNVLNRPLRMLADKDLSAMEKASVALPMVATMSLLWPLQFLVGEGRDALLGDPTRKEATGGEKAMLALSRSGLIGAADPLLNLFTGVRYGRDIATTAAGPVLGRAATGAQTGVEYFSRNSERTNAAERKLAKAFYDLGIEPAANFLLAAAPGGSLVAAAATQTIGAGTVREKFVSAVAGAPENKAKAKASDPFASTRDALKPMRSPFQKP